MRNEKRKCLVCGKEYVFIPKKNGEKYCSRKCYYEIMKGKKNPNWKGGTSHAFFSRLAKENLIQKCVVCSSTKNLEIHHIDFNHDHNKLSNLVILCKSCHSKIHDRVNNINKKR